MHHLSIAAAEKIFLPEIGARRHFTGEVPSALFISHDDGVTIPATIRRITWRRRVL
jgi:hypothetical protein